MTEHWLAYLQIAQLLVLAPHHFGGVLVRSRSGPVRDRWLVALEQMAKQNGLSVPLRKIPNAITDENLLGGLDIESTLKQGKPVLREGVLAKCDQGIVVLPMAERLEIGIAARIASALDHGAIQLERDGQSKTMVCRIGVIVLDESIEDDEHVNPKLMERCAFHIDLDEFAWQSLPDEEVDKEFSDFDPSQVQTRLAEIELDDDQIDALVGIAIQLGIASIRAVQFTVRTARYLAALDPFWEGAIPSRDHIERAVSMVLIPRATQLPEQTPEEQANEETPPPEVDDTQSEESNAPQTPDEEVLEDQILDAARASIPADLLARLAQIAMARQKNSSAGKAGVSQMSSKRGRPMGSMAGMPSARGTLSLIDTLRAAVPWQAMRRRETANKNRIGRPCVLIQKDDFRIKRYRERTQTLTTFVVDASGSSAMNRLAEAKGAVELLLAECYVRRDQVALIAFRGSEAELLLSPTRSLVRAKRSLASLPGGGGTPLARAIDSAYQLAKASLKKGMTPTLVFLTDGRANIARDGTPGRAQAQVDAEQSARMAAQVKVRSLWIDTSPQAREEGQHIAHLIGSYYLPLPHAGAQELSQAVIQVLHQ
ncbi:MAG: magnesium chelatase subunit D [Burkholderiaceae bacterium]|nr:magnesium chelatase subunit D [Burkholderiaceae bacterium]